MTPNKATVERYMDGFNLSDHDLILACLTDDVVWDMPGAFHLEGKQAFDKEIEHGALVGRPKIWISRVIEEHDVVVAEGSIEAMRKGGSLMKAGFCEVFEMRDALIRRLTSYLMEIK